MIIDDGSSSGHNSHVTTGEERNMTHPDLIDTMSRPDFYPHRPETVEVMQTHISYIFIAGHYVYKVKKAVDFGFLDFTTLEKRRFYCGEELRLNRRLAPEVYLKVVEIRQGDDGRLHLERKGRIVDYAVVMKKLPPDRMLIKLLLEGRVDLDIMDLIAIKLVKFHRTAESGGEIESTAGIETVRKNHDENFEQTEKYVGITIVREKYDLIKSYANRFMTRQRLLLEGRVRNHRIRDCHGDLHLEHICLDNGHIIIFDCIEFNKRFRYADVAAEVAFLAMDLDYRGYPEHARAFVTAYVKHSGDHDVEGLVDFYKCYYAYVRGKVISFRIDDRTLNKEDREEAFRTAGRYFDLAYSYAAKPETPILILTAGLVGTGKSVLAANIAPLLGVEIIRTDILRKEMLHIPKTEHRYEDFGAGVYSEEMTGKTYAKALELAEQILKAGHSVIIDASYKRKTERLRAKEAAKQLGASFLIIECICPEDIIKRRLQERLTETGEPSDGRWEIYQTQKNDFDPFDEAEKESHMVVRTDRPPDDIAWRTIGEIKKRLED
jgi:uncharacterized protein